MLHYSCFVRALPNYCFEKKNSKNHGRNPKSDNIRMKEIIRIEKNRLEKNFKKIKRGNKSSNRKVI